MRLSDRQRTYLTELEQGPKWRPDDTPFWFHALWIGYLIDVAGSSVYISEAGRRALKEQADG